MTAVWRAIFLFTIYVSFALGDELKIATYNVKNLFDCRNDGSEYRDFRVGTSEWNCNKAERKFKLISQAIKAINADIIALQEIENEQILKELKQAAGYQYFAFSKPKGSPVGVGLLSRLKPTRTQIFSVPNVKTRDILRADFEFEGYKFSLFTLHFPAQNNSLKQRETAFATLKSVVYNEPNTILLGDFNTPYGKKSLLNDLLTSRNLIDLWRFVPKNERYSHTGLSALDHVVVSADMTDGAGLEYVYGSFAPVRDDKFSQNLYSDHFALKFKIGTQKFDTKFTPANVNDIHLNPNHAPYKLTRAVVTHTDKKGFIIAQDRRGIYVYDPDHERRIGDVIDAIVGEVGKFHSAIEIRSLFISKLYDERADASAQMLKSDELPKARAGDVFESIGGQLRNGRLYTEHGDIKIYAKSGKIKDDENVKFKHARVASYRGRLQLLVE